MEPIENYAIIGDCRAAALVSKSGSIDWMCWPRFDAPPLFGALLDPSAGCWRIAPERPYRVDRRYTPGTNVLETRFVTESGSCVVTDLMPVMSEVDKAKQLVPEHEVLRIVECDGGEIQIGMHFEPRSGYALRRLQPKRAGAQGFRFEVPQGLLLLRSELPLELGPDGVLRAELRLRAGDTRCSSLTLAESWPAVIPPLGAHSRETAARSVTW